MVSSVAYYQSIFKGIVRHAAQNLLGYLNYSRKELISKPLVGDFGDCFLNLERRAIQVGDKRIHISVVAYELELLDLKSCILKVLKRSSAK